MDTSDEYAKQCDCPEIQGLRPSEQLRHDFWWFKKQPFKEYINNKYHCLWLPRQDQIQEMMFKNNPRDVCGLATGLANFMQGQQRFYKSGRVKKLYPVGSMEQLWLAFYMSEKHQKFWSKEGWVNEKDNSTG